MLNKEQIENIKGIVAKNCHEEKTAKLIDDTLLEIEEELGTEDYVTAYVLPENVDLANSTRFVVFEKETKKFYDFSVVPRVYVTVDITEGNN